MSERITEGELADWVHTVATTNMLEDHSEVAQACGRAMLRLIAEVRRQREEADEPRRLCSGLSEALSCVTTQLARVIADHDTMRETLARAQARGTELLERARRAERRAALWRARADESFVTMLKGRETPDD